MDFCPLWRVVLCSLWSEEEFEPNCTVRGPFDWFGCRRQTLRPCWTGIASCCASLNLSVGEKLCGTDVASSCPQADCRIFGSFHVKSPSRSSPLFCLVQTSKTTKFSVVQSLVFLGCPSTSFYFARSVFMNQSAGVWLAQAGRVQSASWGSTWLCPACAWASLTLAPFAPSRFARISWFRTVLARLPFAAWTGRCRTLLLRRRFFPDCAAWPSPS